MWAQGNPRVNGTGAPLTLELAPNALEQIALRAAAIVAERATDVPEYLTAAEAATYMRCGSKQRVYDLVSQGRLEPCRDGSRLLFKRSTVDAYLATHRDTSLRSSSASRNGDGPAGGRAAREITPQQEGGSP